MELVRHRLLTMTQSLACVVIDACFLALWVVIQLALEALVFSREGLSEVDESVLGIFRWVFTASTLFPVLVYTGVDLWLVVRDAQHQINGGSPAGESSDASVD